VEDEPAGTWIAVNTPRKAVLAGCQGHFNAVSTVAGKVLYHSAAKLEWRLGYRTGQRAEEVRRLLKTLDDPAIAPKVRYIVNVRGACPELSVAGYQGAPGKSSTGRGITPFSRKGEPQKP
jgi:hypothetical protein